MMPNLVRHKFEHRNKEGKKKTSKFFLSETGTLRVLIFGILHFLVDFFQVCSYDASRIKTGPAPEHHKFEHRNKEGKLQNSSSLKLEGINF